MRARWILLLLVLAPATPRADVSAEFVGPESCKGCHPDAYEAWRRSKHSRASDSLTGRHQQDARCITCHSPNLKDKQVAQVTCESCHGGGQYYVGEYVMRDPELARLVGLQDPSERACRTCHDASSPSLLPFDFREKLELIDHWSKARAERAEAARKSAPPEPSARAGR